MTQWHKAQIQHSTGLCHNLCQARNRIKIKKNKKNKKEKLFFCIEVKWSLKMEAEEKNCLTVVVETWSFASIPCVFYFVLIGYNVYTYKWMKSAESVVIFDHIYTDTVMT